MMSTSLMVIVRVHTFLNKTLLANTCFAFLNTRTGHGKICHYLSQKVLIYEESFLKVNQSEPDSATVCVDEVADHIDIEKRNINQEVDYDENHDAFHSTIPSFHLSGKVLLSMQKRNQRQFSKV